VLKGLGFLDDNGAPTDRYFRFLDHSQSRAVLAEAIREAYDELFTLNRNAQELSVEEVRGKFRSLTQGQKSENVVNWMANTFKALCDFADWSAPAVVDEPPRTKVDDTRTPPPPQPPEYCNGSKELELHYNIQLILPESRDQSVYDALFSSLRRHLF
jgi:hypothetical protein